MILIHSAKFQMLNSKLIHPEILSALGRAGHGSKVLIADGNFPFSTKTNRDAEKVFLNLSPGIVGCIDTLKAICSAVSIESACVMAPPTTGEFAVTKPEIWSSFLEVITSAGNDISLDQVGRFNFYEDCLSSDVALVIATGEQRIFANLLLTIGVVR